MTASFLAAAGAAFLIYQTSYRPLRCHMKKRSVQASTAVAAADRNEDRARLLARRNLRSLSDCLGLLKGDPDLDMIVAANYRVLGRYDDAIQLYETALGFERRPEIYLQLGLTHLEAGRRGLARESLLAACLFDPRLILLIPDLPLQVEIRAAVDRQLPHIVQRAAARSKAPSHRHLRTPEDQQLKHYGAEQLPGRIGTVLNGARSVRVAYDRREYLIFGPGAELEAGEYVLVTYFRLDSTASRPAGPLLTMEVSASNSRVVARREVLASELEPPGTWRRVELRFSLPQRTEGVEFRVFWHGLADLTFESLDLIRR